MVPSLRSAHRRLLASATVLLLSAFATLRANHPLEGPWFLTAFEHEVGTNPVKFTHGSLSIKRVTITETTPGTLRLELRNAAGVLLETEERAFTQNGAFYESTRTETEAQGRERQRLGFQVLRHDLVLAHDIGAFFALDDRNLFDAFGFAGVLTRAPLPRTNATLWAGPYAGQEWIYETNYDNGPGTWSLGREAGEFDFQIDKTGATYRFTATFPDEEAPDSGTLRASGAFLALDEDTTGGTSFTSGDAFGTVVFDRGRYRVLQVSSTELVLLGLSGGVTRISPTANNPFSFNPYNSVDYADSSVAYFRSTANFAFEGQAISLPAPLGQTAAAFSARGLPTGITINAATGALTGFANAKPGNYTITRTAGSFTDLVYLRILPYPSNLFANPEAPRIVASEYEALLRAPATGLPVGKVELKLTNTGIFSGKLTTGAARTVALRSRLAPDSEGTEASASIPLTDGRHLAVTIDVEGRIFAALSTADTTLGVAELGSYGGRVRFYDSINPAPGGQARGNAAYTVAFSPVESQGPGGHGWATGAITPAGNLILRGKLADGRPLTATLRPTSGGYLPYLKPYGTGLVDNYLAGRLQLTARERGGFHQPADATPDLYWSKPAALGGSDRIPAFGPVGLDVTLAPWTPIVSAEQFASLFGGYGELAVDIVSEDATNDDPDRALPASLAFTVTNGRLASSVSAPVLDETSATANTRAWTRVWTLAVNLKTGTFTGRFVLSDVVAAGTPRNPLATRTITRAVPYEGVLLQGSGSTEPGVGYFVVPALVRTEPSGFGAITFGFPSR